MIKRGIYEGRAREVICKVYQYFEDEKVSCKELLQTLSKILQNEPQAKAKDVRVPITLLLKVVQHLKKTTQVGKRAADATGANKNTITLIKSQGEWAKTSNTILETPVKKPRGKKEFLNNTQLEKFKSIVKRKLKDNQKFNLYTLLELARSELDYKGSKSTLRRIILRAASEESQMLELEKVDSLAVEGKQIVSESRQDDNRNIDPLESMLVTTGNDNSDSDVMYEEYLRLEELNEDFKDIEVPDQDERVS